MKTLYVDAGGGLTEQALAGALLELIPNSDGFIQELNEQGIPCSIEIEKVFGVSATSFSILADQCSKGNADFTEEWDISGEINDAMSHFQGLEKVCQDVLGVLKILTDAYEVVCQPADSRRKPIYGWADLLMVAAICIMMDRLSPDQVYSAPVGVSDGRNRLNQQVCMLENSLVLQMMQGWKVRMDHGAGCTPVAAALVRYFASESMDLPAIRISGLGNGVMHTEAHDGVVRAVLGKMEGPCQDVVELSCNVDDMTGEAIGFALEQFFAEGAVEAYTVPIGMKKSRPGVKVCVLCKPEQRDRMVHLMLRHTTTLGVRETGFRRYAMSRTFRKIQTPYGIVERKDSTGYGVSRNKYEYEHLAKIAREQGLSLAEVLKILDNATKNPSEE